MSKAGRNEKKIYNPELDSSDTDSDLSEGSSLNTTPEVVFKTGAGHNKNAAESGSIAVLSAENLKDEVSYSTRGLGKEFVGPSGHYLGSLQKARMLGREVVSDVSLINTAKSSCSSNANETDSRSMVKLFSVDTCEPSTNKCFAPTIKLKLSNPMDLLPPKYQHKRHSVPGKPEKVEKKITEGLPDVQSGSMSTLSQKKLDLLHEMRTCTPKQVLSDGLLCSTLSDPENKPCPTGSRNRNDACIEKEVAADLISVRIGESDEILEQGKSWNQPFKPANVEQRNAEENMKKSTLSSIIKDKITFPQTTTAFQDVDKNKTENSSNQNLPDSQIITREILSVLEKIPAFGYKTDSFPIVKSTVCENPIANLTVVPFTHECNAVEDKVSQYTSEMKDCSASAVLHDEQKYNKPPKDNRLTSEVEYQERALKISKIGSKLVATGNHNSTSTETPKNNTQKSAYFANEELPNSQRSHQAPVSASAAVTVSKLNATTLVQDFDQDLFVKHFLEKIKKFDVEQLRQTPFENLISKVEQSIKSSTGRVYLPFWNLYNDVKVAFQEFTASVQRMDQDFKNFVCFPDYELQEKLKTFEEIKTKIPANFPASLRQCAREKIEVFTDSYKVHNTFVREGEFKAYEALIEVAADHYYKEMKLAVADKYRGQVWLDELHNKCFAETKEYFVSAASFTHKRWEATFTNRFRDEISSKYREVQKIHIKNREILEDKLEQIKTEIATLCESNLAHKLTCHSLLATVDTFDELARAWKKESLRIFEDAIQKDVGEQFHVPVSTSRNQFKMICDAIVQKQRKTGVAKIEKARADRMKEKIKQERKEKETLKLEREKNEKLKLEREKNEKLKLEREKNEKLKLEREKNEKLKLEREKNEKLKLEREKNEKLKLEREKNEKLKLEREKQEKEKQELNKRQVKGQYQQTSSKPKLNCSQPEVTIVSASLLSIGPSSLSSSIDIAIYFGLERTLVGIIKPGTDEFHLLADAENCLYFENHQLLAFSEEDKKRFGHLSGTSFAHEIIQCPVGKEYEVKINGYTKYFRMEDFISFLFCAIKWHIEIILGVRVSTASVICLPQCFNNVQARVVQDGAKLAGFQNLVFINDTNAIALACMIRNNILNGTIIAVNTSEGFVDTGLFKVEDAFISTTAVSGHHFQIKSGWWFNYSQPDRYFFGPRDDPDKFSKMLSFNGTYTRRNYPQGAKVVVVGSNEEKVQDVQRHYGLEPLGIQESSYNVLEGAAILAALYDGRNVMRQRWECMGTGKTTPEAWNKFIQNLLSWDVKVKTKSLNTEKGRPLTTDVFNAKKQNDFLQSKATFHELKMTLLQTCRQLKSEVQKTLIKCDQAEGAVLSTRLLSIESEVRRSGITPTQLMTVENNLQEFSADVRSLASR